MSRREYGARDYFGREYAYDPYTNDDYDYIYGYGGYSSSRTVKCPKKVFDVFKFYKDNNKHNQYSYEIGKLSWT